MENINVQSDIREFIEKNATNSLPPYKLEFIPYVSEIESKTDHDFVNYPNTILSDVRDFISNVFFIEPPENEVRII